MSKIIELRNKRNTLWEQTKAFLEEHRNENGLVEASAVEQYNRMAADVKALGDEIQRLEDQMEMDAKLSAATSAPVRSDLKLGQRKGIVRPTATAEYNEAFWNMMRGVNTMEVRDHRESTKTNAGTRKIPMTEEVFRCFQAILEDREAPTVEQMIDGYVGFLYLDDQGMPLVAMHWEHRFNHMVNRYNEIFRVQMPNITPHICRHTYCSNQARAGMNPKTLQYLMGHSDISVTMNVYTHLGLEDAAAEMARMKVVEDARKEQEKISGETGSREMTQKMFRVI